MLAAKLEMLKMVLPHSCPIVHDEEKFVRESKFIDSQ
jgi:hypothetical protein